MEGEQIRLRVTTFQGTAPLLRLNPLTGNRLSDEMISEIECFHGTRRIALPCVLDNSLPESVVAVSRPAFDYLKLGAYTTNSPVWLTTGKIRFGPLIGILSNPVWNKDKGTLRSTKQLASLERLVRAGHEYGAVCFLFSIHSVDMKANTVRGYTLQNDKWVSRVFPLPDVIYDQLVSRRLERDKDAQAKRTALSNRYKELFFNDGFFDKWQVFEWLREDTHVKNHLPMTARHTTLSQAASFINSHSVTFLKPLHGSLGLGIARFVKQKDGSFIYEFKQKTDALKRGHAASASAVLKPFRTRLKNRPYIWQEGLMLATYEQRPVDIRILMQRDHTGEWKRTKMFARVAKSGDFTSNLTGGGDAMPVDNAFAKCIPQTDKRNKAKRQIKLLSKQIAESIEKASGRTYGEMGIDLGVDKSGNVWVIEVNSKPRKTPATEKGSQELVDLSFERPIRYAIYLATSQVE